MTAPPIGDERQQTGPEPRGEAARPASRRLLIVLMNTDPRNVAELGAPFYHAANAAAMD